MTQGEPLGVALIGAGMVARTHLAAIADTPGVALRAVMARRSERAAALAPEGVAVTTSLTQIADDPAIDFAIVATPPDARTEVIAPLAAAGKHVLLEKPMGRDAEEARRVVGLCEGAGVTLGVVLQHRMRAASQAAMRLLQSGALGAVGVVEITVPWWRDQAYYDEPGRGSYARDGGGVLISQAIHTLDLALALAGPVAEVRALSATTRFHRMEAEDFVSAGLRFESGAVGSLVASTASFPGRAEAITLHCDAASLTLEAGVCTTRWRDGRVETAGAQAGTGGGADPMAFTHDWHQAVIADFADALRAGRPPAISGQAGLAVHDLIAALTRAAQTGRPEVLT